MKKLVLGLACVFLFGSLAHAKPLPQDVKDLIAKMEECNHWAGEEPYDKARADEIAKKMTELKCDTLDSEKAAAKEKYKGNRQVISAIKKAETDFQ